MNCKKLTGPLTVASTDIPDECFSGCLALTVVVINYWVETIGDASFSGCQKLNTIIVEAFRSPPVIKANSFMNVSSSYSKNIYVQDSILESYKTAENWSSLFASVYKLKAMSTLPETLRSVVSQSTKDLYGWT